MKKLIDGKLVALTEEEELEYQRAIEDLSKMPPEEKTESERIAELEEELKAFKILMGQEV